MYFFFKFYVFSVHWYLNFVMCKFMNLTVMFDQYITWKSDDDNKILSEMKS